MNQERIVLRTGPADAKWHREQKHTECAHLGASLADGAMSEVKAYFDKGTK